MRSPTSPHHVRTQRVFSSVTRQTHKFEPFECLRFRLASSWHFPSASHVPGYSQGRANLAISLMAVSKVMMKDTGVNTAFPHLCDQDVAQGPWICVFAVTKHLSCQTQHQLPMNFFRIEFYGD
eukprot:5252146-Amphidinium_carterae.2